jgi:phage terminase large subunit
MKLIFDTNGNEKQKEVARFWIDHTTLDIAYGGSKGSGKSYLGCSLIFGDAFLYPGTHYFIARKKLNDIRKFTIPSIYEVFGHWGIKENHFRYNGQDNYFELYNGSRVYLLEAKYLPSDPIYARFGSMQMTRGWIEEAGEFDEAAKNNLSASIGRWKNDLYNLPGKLLQTCNPSKNYLYRDYYKKHKEGLIENWKKFIQALPTDNKKLPKEYIENLFRILSKNEKERLLFGNWEYDDDPATLCDYDKIVNLFSNDFKDLHGQKYIVADVARLGSDKFVIGIWDGWRVKIRTYEKKRITESYEFIKQIKQDERVGLKNIIVDEDGVGGGLVDLLKCNGFVNNSKCLNGENYENLQAQCAYKLAERINDEKIFIDCEDTQIRDEIIEELEQLKQKNIDGEGRKGIMDKETVKKLIGRSPDFRDMLLMRMWFDLNPNVGKYSISVV